jgi:hypothetical protein
VGPSPKEEGDSKKRPHTHTHTHMTLTDIKRPQAIAVFSKYLVYQVLSGVSVSRGTLCPMTLLAALEDERMRSLGCETPSQTKREGGLDLTGSV